MSRKAVEITPSGPPETILGAEPETTRNALAAALATEPSARRSAVSEVVAAHPRSLESWSQLGALGRDLVESYAAYRVGYHRGLDALRAEGWRGSGYVRWSQPTNRGFLRALHGLAETAAAIGETDEADRCRTFLRQLDPSWPPPSLESERR